MVSRKNILLVEDNPDDVELAMLAFRKLNVKYEVMVATNGEEALDLLFHQGKHLTRPQVENPDLILLDLNLPNLKGIQVLESIRSNKVTQHIPVIIFTTSGEESDLAKSYEQGANSYIRKPVDFDIFLEVVRNIGNYWLNLNVMPKIFLNGSGN